MILRGHSKYHLIKPIKLLDSCFLFLLPLLVETAVAETRNSETSNNKIQQKLKFRETT